MKDRERLEQWSVHFLIWLSLKAKPEISVWSRWFGGRWFQGEYKGREKTVRQERERGRKKSISEWIIAVGNLWSLLWVLPKFLKFSLSIIPHTHLCHLIILIPYTLLLFGHYLMSDSATPWVAAHQAFQALHIRWPRYWSFSFNISPSNEHSGLFSFREDWLDLLAVQGTLKSLL